MLNQASNAKNETIVAEEKEQVKLAYMAAITAKLGADVTEEDLQNELDTSVGTSKTTVTTNSDDTLNVLFNDTQHNYNVNKGIVSETEPEEIVTSIYAKMYKDGTLIFSSTNYTDNSRELAEDYGDISNENYYDDGISFNYPKWIEVDSENNKAKNIIIYDKIYPTNNVTYWFQQYSGTELNLSNMDTRNVTNMSSMFFGCSNLENLDLSRFNTRNVTDMSYMFSDCSNLESLNVSGFDTKNVTNMMRLFYDCSNLESLDLSEFNTKNVETMREMFNGCSSLLELELRSFDTHSVTDMSEMFRNCSKLKTINLSSFNTSAVDFMSAMFWRV